MIVSFSRSCISFISSMLILIFCFWSIIILFKLPMNQFSFLDALDGSGAYPYPLLVEVFVKEADFYDFLEPLLMPDGVVEPLVGLL